MTPLASPPRCPHLRTRVVVASLAVIAAAFGVACSARPGGSVPAGTATTTTPGTRTTVEVRRDTDAPPNPACMAFCKRLAACWYAMPNVDAMLSEGDVLARCQADQGACKKVTTEAHCCGATADCQDFVQCYDRSHDQPSDCKPPSRAEPAR